MQYTEETAKEHFRTIYGWQGMLEVDGTEFEIVVHPVYSSIHEDAKLTKPQGPQRCKIFCSPAIECQCPYSGLRWRLRLIDISSLLEGLTGTPITPDEPFCDITDIHGHKRAGLGTYSQFVEVTSVPRDAGCVTGCF